MKSLRGIQTILSGCSDNKHDYTRPEIVLNPATFDRMEIISCKRCAYRAIWNNKIRLFEENWEWIK